MNTLTNLLSLALDYPSETQRRDLSLARTLYTKENPANDPFLSPKTFAELMETLDFLEHSELMALQVQATDLFDLGKGTSLRLFEHVHGDSRARGQAMVDLVNYYKAKGLELEAAELPDHLAVVLEAASSLDNAEAKALLAEVGPVLELLCLNHEKQKSPWTPCLRAVLELSGGDIAELAQMPLPEDENIDIDALWAEPEISFADPSTCKTGV